MASVKPKPDVRAPVRKAEPGERLLVVHEFKARSADELNMSKGDFVDLIERDDDFDDGWYLGRHCQTCETGLFPQVYTTLAPLRDGRPPDGNHTPLSVRAFVVDRKRELREPSPPFMCRTSATMPAADHLRDSPNPSDDGGPEAVDLARALSSIGSDGSGPEPQPTGSETSQSSRTPSTSASATTAIATGTAAAAATTTGPPSSIGPSTPRSMSLAYSGGQYHSGEDSPVMHQTLSVIEEHITNMHTPRHSRSTAERQLASDSASEYSSHIDPPPSYIAGHETDEEDQPQISETEIRRWSAAQVAHHLRSIGVEERHCDVFFEQEISGDVLLGLDRQSLFIKEFDLGSVGRRLRTWQTIQNLQQEAMAADEPTRPSTGHLRPVTATGTPPSAARSRASVTPTVLPRIPSFTEGSNAMSPSPRRFPPQPQPQPQPPPPPPPLGLQHPSAARDAHSRQSSYTSQVRPSSPRRPSAASIRDLNHHSRRHSSMDHGGSARAASMTTGGDATYSSSPARTPSTSHTKQASFDRNWSMGAATAGLKNSNATPRSAGSVHRATLSTADTSTEVSQRLDDTGPATSADLDRGYFSQGENEVRRSRNVLRKRDTATHSRNSSYHQNHPDDHRRLFPASASFRHARFGSADSVRDSMKVASPTSPAAQAYYGKPSKDRKRKKEAANSPFLTLPPSKGEHSPTVTRLDGDTLPSGGQNDALASGARDADRPRTRGTSFRSMRQIWDPSSRTRSTGARVVSDAVTGGERALVASPASSVPSPIKESPVQSPTLTGSSTPSGGRSLEIEGVDPAKAPVAPSTANSSTAGGGGVGGGVRGKTKKATSAYLRGLEKKMPKEQMVDCDYCGWMKKKSTSLMSTWKPRLFVLRGRRLSYYYSEKDEQERGVIDISSHRVLPADNDRITGLHATLTGATTSPTSPVDAVTPTMAATDAAAMSPLVPASSGSDAVFIFKLVPPRAGISRAVNFTKPTVHYFAVDNIHVGRLWMAALMKATIARDDESKPTSTYQQKTISLAKAQQLRFRPPALMGPDEDDGDEEGGDAAVSAPVSASIVRSPTGIEEGLNIEAVNLGDERRGSGLSTSSGGGGVGQTTTATATATSMATTTSAGSSFIQPEPMSDEGGATAGNR
ncbi:MAG: polar growth protein [Lichina confinis]|nr:MAG: polar growth protein [Lichina confinis]